MFKNTKALRQDLDHLTREFTTWRDVLQMKSNQLFMTLERHEKIRDLLLDELGYKLEIIPPSDQEKIVLHRIKKIQRSVYSKEEE